MSKIKKIWTENKVLFVLGIILIICLIVFATVSITYFYGASKDKYGNRLDITKEVPLDSKLYTDIENELKANEKVIKASAKLKGKIVYINVTFSDETKLEDAKLIAETVIKLFNEDELNVYDLEFIIQTENVTDNAGFVALGARNSNGSGSVVWNNTTSVEKDQESSGKKQ